jgi:PAS domain S-box-containing protein
LGLPPDDEEKLLRSVAIQNAQSILLARQRAEQELVDAKEALELRTAELERANTLIRTIAENAASCLLMLDDRGVATYVNPAAIAETGFSGHEFGAKPFHDLLHPPADRGGHSADGCAVRIARERMRPLRDHRELFMRKDGSTFPVSCSLAPLQRDGHAAGAVLEFRDITEEELAHRTLEEASRRKDQFLATLSHELRTPMTAVLGWARMLKMGLAADEAREAVDAIEKSAEVQAQMIDDVLDVSQVAAGKMTFTPMPVDIDPALRAAMTTVHPAAAAKGIEILASVPPTLPRMLGDEGRLQQIIWNLLANAVKFTPRGGEITVRVSVEGSFLRLTVSDNGKGIDLDYLPHVFEPFSQEDASMSRSHQGIGLGLSIVRSLVEMQGGRIRASSDGAGQGAEFTAEFPIIETAAAVVQESSKRRAAGPLPPVEEMANLNGRRVLVIDDQPHTRDLISAIVARAGADVHVATSVREGLERFDAVAPDVIVCDLAMPEEDGFAFLRALRALPAPFCATPVLALTAFGRPEDRRQALESGFDAYLKKPVDPAELASTVARMLPPARRA